MKNWTYQGELVSSIIDVPKDAYGFVYLIDIKRKGKPSLYIGKKVFYHNIKRPFGKKDALRWRQEHPRGPIPKSKTVRRESDWLTYQGSHPVLKEHEGPIEKKIICFAESKRHLTYLEEKYQHLSYVLENSNYLNDNIGGRYFKNNLK